MSKTLQEMIDGLSAKQRAEVDARAAALIAEELSLRDLRRTLNLTQTDVARRLKKGQDVISRIEQRGDLLLSTLNEYLQSLGGELELICRFKDRASVRITSIRPTASSSKNKQKAFAA